MSITRSTREFKLPFHEKSRAQSGKAVFAWKKLPRPLVHFLGLLPLVHLFILWQTRGLTVNPIQFVEQFLGRAALNLLLCSLAVTPLVTLTGWRIFNRHRRALGLYAFLYFSLHFLVFLVLDYGLDLEEVFRLLVEKYYLIAGALAGLVLAALAFTSFKVWMKKMGKNWQRLHRLVYIGAALVILHYALAVKGSLLTLEGNILRPLVMGGILTILLVLRIPPVRRFVASWRQR